MGMWVEAVVSEFILIDVLKAVAGPQVLTLDYTALVPSGSAIKTLTLGIAADDFQDTVFGEPFTARLNGGTDTALTNKLNSLNETGPIVHFFTVGVAPSTLNSNDDLTLTINEGGDGGDGWAMSSHGRRDYHLQCRAGAEYLGASVDATRSSFRSRQLPLLLLTGGLH